MEILHLSGISTGTWNNGSSDPEAWGTWDWRGQVDLEPTKDDFEVKSFQASSKGRSISLVTEFEVESFKALNREGSISFVEIIFHEEFCWREDINC